MKGLIVPPHMEGCSDSLRGCPEALNITFRQLNYSLPSKGGKLKEVLHDVSGQILSGRLTAILGPSGAGKTSLLNVLAGFKTKGVRGSVLVNGVERDLEEFRSQSCYITQDMSLLGKLTTLETLTMAARMKLSSSHAEQSLVVSDIIDLLGMAKSRETFVQSLSGGEKKRLSIGLELITNPPIMFFDEPTSGLDSVSSAQIMFHLRKLASSGRSVACVIHQPNSRLCNLFDDVILLAEGSILYCGPTNQMVSVFEEAGFHCPQYYNRADFALEVACLERGNDLSKMIKRFRCTPPLNYETVDEPRDLKEDIPHDIVGDKLSSSCNNSQYTTAVKNYKVRRTKYPVSCALQFWVLLQRTLICTYRDLYMAQIRLLSHLLISVLLGIIFYDIGNDGAKIHSNAACIFFFVMFLFFSNAMPTIMTFPSEMSVFLREHLNNWYSLSPYFFAKCIANIPLQVLCPSSFLALAYWLTGQPSDFLRFSMALLVCILLVIMAQATSMMIGAACDTDLGVFLVPVITIPMLLFSGFFQRLQDIPFYLKWVAHLSYFKNAFEGLCVSVYGYDRPKLDCSAAFCFFRQGDKFITDLGMREGNYWSDVIALTAWALGTHVLLYLVLRWRIHMAK